MERSERVNSYFDVVKRLLGSCPDNYLTLKIPGTKLTWTFFHVSALTKHWPIGQRFPSRVSGWITGSHELDPLKLDPGLVWGSVEAAVFNHLPKEWNHSLCAWNIKCIVWFFTKTSVGFQLLSLPSFWISKKKGVNQVRMSWLNKFWLKPENGVKGSNVPLYG